MTAFMARMRDTIAHMEGEHHARNGGGYAPDGTADTIPAVYVVLRSTDERAGLLPYLSIPLDPLWHLTPRPHRVIRALARSVRERGTLPVPPGLAAVVVVAESWLVTAGDDVPGEKAELYAAAYRRELDQHPRRIHSRFVWGCTTPGLTPIRYMRAGFDPPEFLEPPALDGFGGDIPDAVEDLAAALWERSPEGART